MLIWITLLSRYVRFRVPLVARFGGGRLNCLNPNILLGFIGNLWADSPEVTVCCLANELVLERAL